MITAVDTNVLSDVFLADPRFFDASRSAIEEALAVGPVIVCDVVLAEMASAYADPRDAVPLLRSAGIVVEPVRLASALAAGRAWRQYRLNGGSRERLIPDFLVAAHASIQADRLITRDVRVPRTYFPELVVINPGASR